MTSKSTFSNSKSKSYATALFELSKENSELPKVEEEIKSFKLLLEKNLNFKEVMLSPTINKEEKKNVLYKIADQNNFTNILRKFFGFIADKNRLFYIEKIIESFLNLVSINKGEIKAKILSSKKLSTEEQKEIQNQLSENFKSQLKIDYEYDPNLIGGIVVQVGSIMVDTSIKTKLKKLEKNMLET